MELLTQKKKSSNFDVEEKLKYLFMSWHLYRTIVSESYLVVSYPLVKK